MHKVWLIYVLSFFLFLLAVRATSANEMQVYPAYEFIHGDGVTFNVVIYCNPTEPIKSHEFKLLFNPLCLQANSVSEGDFFGDYPTFFSSGIINNTAGTIINIYDLVLGPGNITTPGILVNISFTTLTDAASELTIYDAGVTNETKYLPLTIMNGGRRVSGLYEPWDVNRDGDCDYLDISAVVSHYTRTCNPPGSQRWDIIPDGRCNYLEISILVAHL